MLDDGREVIFFGTDEGEEEVRETKTIQNFGRSMSRADAMSPDNLLCYEMNGAPLPQANGFPLRLIAPGWFGIANVKWLKRIEVRPSRYMGRFMAQDYVTLREERQDGETTGCRRRSAARPQVGACQGDAERRPVPDRWRRLGRADRARGGPDRRRAMADGDHRPQRRSRVRVEDMVAGLGRCRARDAHHYVAGRRHRGNVQPAPDDPVIANKHTYWESNGQVTRQVRIERSRISIAE